MVFDKELLDILACPKCKNELCLNSKEDGLVCNHCHIVFEIRDDIPILLVDQASKLSDYNA
jgi:uncharacterized protein YbaR (Trm112 family)